MTTTTVLWLSLLLPAATAAPVFSAGVETTLNDPFLRTTGLRLGAHLPLAPRFSLGLTAGGYPSWGNRDWKALTSQVTEDYSLYPDLSRIRARATVDAQVTLLEQIQGARTRALDLTVGLGAVYTVDDIDVIQGWDDPDFLATQRQLHPLWTLGLSGEIWWHQRGARLRFEHSEYDEIVMSEYKEDRRPLWIGAEALWRLP